MRLEVLQKERRRSRVLYAALFAATIATGLASRRFPAYQPAFVSAYAGDTLWAVMVYWGVALLRPAASDVRLGAVTIAVAWAVEASQLYRAPWLDAIRDTRAGMLVLGQGFLWSDLACYTAGVALAMAVDRGVVAHRSRRPPHPSSRAPGG